MRSDPGSIAYDVLRSRQESRSLMGWVRFLVDRYHTWSRRHMMHKVLRAGMFILLALIVVVELLGLSASAKVSGLERIHADPDGTWYINAKTMVSPVGNRVSFWSTVVPVKGSEYYSELGTALDKARKNPLRLEYVQTLQDVDCATGKISTLNILFYDKLDRIVHSITVPREAQQTASTGLASETLLAAVCRSQMARVMGE